MWASEMIVGKGASCQTSPPEFNAWNPCSERGEPVSATWPLVWIQTVQNKYKQFKKKKVPNVMWEKVYREQEESADRKSKVDCKAKVTKGLRGSLLSNGVFL